MTNVIPILFINFIVCLLVDNHQENQLFYGYYLYLKLFLFAPDIQYNRGESDIKSGVYLLQTFWKFQRFLSKIAKGQGSYIHRKAINFLQIMTNKFIYLQF